MRTDNDGKPVKRRRAAPLLWLSGALAAVLLVLGVNGTLSSWTQAIITNNSNTAGAANAVALSETDGTSTCATTTAPDNTDSTCSTINKYGGNTSMSPDGPAEVVDVTFTNTGTGPATKFGYAPGACANTDVSPATANLCSNGDLTIAVSCSAGTSFDSGSLIAALTTAASTPTALAAIDTSAESVAVAAGGSVTCEFTTTLSSTAPPADGGASISQPIVWTLTA